MSEDNRILCDNCCALNEPGVRCGCLDGLRDFFAAECAKAILEATIDRVACQWDGKFVAEQAYEQADRLLKAREGE